MIDCFKRFAESVKEAIKSLRKMSAQLAIIMPNRKPARLRDFRHLRATPLPKRTPYKPRWYWKRIRSNPRR